MRRSRLPFCSVLLALATCWSEPLRAQLPPGAAASSSVDPATIPLPELAFQPSPEAEADYDKYFYFHREDTDFATAYADLRECDGFARGLSARGTPVYGTGIFGDAIGSAISDAIYGSAERRRLRRLNMRTCMGFKGYRIYGLPKELWQRFNFEEGNAHIPDGERQRLLRIQARVASGPTPLVEEISQ
jgi:hypothetical protein